MFRVEFSVHLTYSKGMTSFRREEELPFVPFIGLDVLDDVLGQFLALILTLSVSAIVSVAKGWSAPTLRRFMT